MKTFVVTGASGYIGSHMCYELKQSYPDCEIIAVDKIRKNKLNHLYDKFVLCDISNTNRFVFDKTVDCIFHFAAYAVVSEGQEKPYTYYRNNLMSAMYMMDQAIHHKVKNFVFSSSCSVYGNSPSEMPISEWERKNPKSVYAQTKSIGEEVLLSASRQNDIRVSILRYFNVAGRNVEAGLYEEHEPETHLIPNLTNGKEVNIYGDGSIIRDYIHVVDLCKAHIAAYEYMEKNDKRISCNIGTGVGYSVSEIIENVESILGTKLKLNWCPPRDGDVPKLVSDTKKMREVLTFEPEHDIVSIIKSMRN